LTDIPVGLPSDLLTRRPDIIEDEDTLPFFGRFKARLAFAAARHYIPLRELGRGTFVPALDGIRAALASIASDLVSQGRLEGC
jgi:hypothetical protein